jgi:hypothetical protein
MTTIKPSYAQSATKITPIVTRLEYVSDKLYAGGQSVGGICPPSRWVTYRGGRTYSTRRVLSVPW